MTFTVYGSITSNNRVARRVGRRTIANPEAVADKSRVFQLAYAAAQKAGWTWPEACAVTITCYNTRKDISNCEKVIGDGMIGAVYADDSSIIDLHILKARDLGGERYDVTIEAREVLVKPKKAPKRKQAA